MSNPLLFFVNPKSGGGLGGKLISRIKDMPDVYIVKLPDEENSWTSMSPEILNNPNLRAVICGGDGSVSWIVPLLMKHYGLNAEPSVFRPPAAIIPLGTGNDMSRVLNWGPYFTNHDLRRIAKKINDIRSATEIKNHDVWKVSELPNGETEPKVHMMTNYCSFGTDAKIARDFEDFRTDHQECFCCRCMSKTIYGPIAFKSMCGQPNLNEYTVAKMSFANDESDLKPKSKSKVLCIQQIPSMYAGMDTWHFPEPRSVDDGKFEVTEMGGFGSLLKVQLGMHPTNKIGQADHLEMTTTERMYYQVDGEGYCAEKPATFTVEKYGTYPLLYFV